MKNDNQRKENILIQVSQIDEKIERLLRTRAKLVEDLGREKVEKPKPNREQLLAKAKERYKSDQAEDLRQMKLG